MYLMEGDNRFRRKCYDLVFYRWFENFILLIILFSSVCLVSALTFNPIWLLALTLNLKAPPPFSSVWGLLSRIAHTAVVHTRRPT